MDVLRQVSAVLFVCALLGIALWIARKGKVGALRILSIAGRNKSMTVLERTALTPQHFLHRIGTRDFELLLVTHPQGCTVLHRKSTTGASKPADPQGIMKQA